MRRKNDRLLVKKRDTKIIKKRIFVVHLQSCHEVVGREIVQ